MEKIHYSKLIDLLLRNNFKINRISRDERFTTSKSFSSFIDKITKTVNENKDQKENFHSPELLQIQYPSDWGFYRDTSLDISLKLPISANILTLDEYVLFDEKALKAFNKKIFTELKEAILQLSSNY